jgi:hypothetical protein
MTVCLLREDEKGRRLATAVAVGGGCCGQIWALEMHTINLFVCSKIVCLRKTFIFESVTPTNHTPDV